MLTDGQRTDRPWEIIMQHDATQIQHGVPVAYIGAQILLPIIDVTSALSRYYPAAISTERNTTE